ncbi:MAG: c-type cytochrome [Thermoleophilia bacterium]|nr:c-type cytochrome [Thermoleophilia bacterium]
MTVLAFDAYVQDWLNLILRWLHVIAAIAWIGTSFYFVLLDQSLRPAKRELDRDEGVGGELWEVHGGGFYRVQKFTVAPRTLPDHLAWFKWEAYATWLSGFALMLVLFYLDAGSTLVGPAGLGASWTVAISLVLLAAAWVAYDVLNRSTGDGRIIWPVLGVLAAVSAWGSSELFTPRGAWLQVGAMIGTVMSANVFFNIIPAHWELIRAREAGREPDPAPGIQAKQRSVHNNYLTLPVLLVMLAGHFTFLTGHDQAWLALVALMALGAWARLFFNLRHRGRTHWWMLLAGAAALVLLAVAFRPPAAASEPAPAALVEQGEAVFATAGCVACHTLAAVGAAGVVGPNLDALQPDAARVTRAVTSGIGGMPAFTDQLTAAEIDAVAAYVSTITKE